MSSSPFSHDQAVKNLIKDYPEEALEFLAEDVVQTLGRPVEVEFLDTGVAKEDVAQPGPGQSMDMAIRYRFRDGSRAILLLVEHWSDAGKLDLLRTATYYLDLVKRFPDEVVLPVALVDDDRPRQLTDTASREAFGILHFLFHTRIIQIPTLDLERFRHTANRVALSFTPNMAGPFDRADRVMQVAIGFRDQGDLAGFRKFFAFWVVEGRLQLEDQREVKQRLKEMDMPEIMEWFREEGIALGKQEGVALGKAEGKIEGKLEGKLEGKMEGIREKALEDARKMREHGIDWAIVTDVTGIFPKDLT